MMIQKLILAGVVAMGVAACSSTGGASDNLTTANGGGLSPKGAVETGDSGTTASGNATAGAAGTATNTNSMGTSSSSSTTSGTRDDGALNNNTTTSNPSSGQPVNSDKTNNK